MPLTHHPTLSILTRQVKQYRIENFDPGQARRLTPIIPELWEAGAGRSRGQEIKTILANMVKPQTHNFLTSKDIVAILQFYIFQNVIHLELFRM